MPLVTVSPQFKIKIPASICESMHIYSGQQLQVLPYGQGLILLPFKTAKELRGFLKGIDTRVERAEDRLE